MPTPSQIESSRQNSKASTGPTTETGKQISSQNALQLGLTTAGDFIPTSEAEEFIAFTGAYQSILNPVGIAEGSCALEVRSAAWRLRRCRALESHLPEDLDAQEKTVKSIQRARSQAHNITRKAMLELRRLQAERRAKQIEAPTEPSASFCKIETPGPKLVPSTRQIPRGGPCPCRSGKKYKRCCGRNAPPVLHKGPKNAA